MLGYEMAVRRVWEETRAGALYFAARTQTHLEALWAFGCSSKALAFSVVAWLPADINGLH